MDRIGVAATHAVLVPWVALLSVLIVPAPVQAQTTVAGFTPGSFRVTESGAGAYRIPIRVPPGIAGMEPSLALAYNSQAGNGLLGVGWSLEGLSAITRCPRTMAQDGVRGGINYDLNDRYCLDGQRLMLIAGASYGADGAEYRTERESFSKIISYGAAGNGPAWFKVWTKSGQLIEYGNTDDSRIEAQGKTTVRVWTLNKVSDTKGNYLTISYTEDNLNGDYSPSRIDYTANASTPAQEAVTFSYASRSDQTPLYQGGSLSRTMNLLSTVKTFASSVEVREYRLTYDTSGTFGRSRLTSLQECSGDGSCIAPIGFTWATETAATRSFGGAGSGSWTGNANGATYSLLGDFNGDGKDDLLGWAYGVASFNVCTSVGSNFNCSSWPATDLSGLIVGDFNGDGNADVGGYKIQPIFLYKTREGEPVYSYRHNLYICINSGASFSCAQWVFDAFRVLDSSEPQNGIVGDFNGDGRSDWAYWNGSSWIVCLSSGTGFSCGTWSGPVAGMFANVSGDFNGDGIDDLIGPAGGNNWNVCLSNGAGFSCSTWTGADSSQWPVFGDFNGDGLQDLARYVTGNTWNVCLSTGSGFSCANWNGVASPETSTKAGDFNGDGKKDLAQSLGNGSWNVCLSTGSGFSCNAWTGTSAAFANTVVGDFNGDRKSDLSGYVSGTAWDTTLAGDPFPDLITGISNSLGNAISLVHKPLTASDTYSKDASATLPDQDVQPPIYVVQSQSVTNGAGGSFTKNYFFKGLKRNFDRRTTLGFREVKEIESLTGITSTVTRRQDWPYAGFPSVVTKAQSSGAILSQATSTYGCIDPASGAACAIAPGNRYLPYLSQSVDTGNDLNGAALPTVTTTSSGVDLYGNVGVVTVSTGDGYSKTTTNTYANDAVNWFLGRLTRSTVQSTTPP